MLDDLGTLVVQAIGFFGIFGFFVYQLLSDGQKNNQSKLISSKTSFKSKESTKTKGWFNRRKEAINEDIKPKKKAWFNR